MMKGDLKARKQMNNFSRWYQCNEPLLGNQVIFIFCVCFPNGEGFGNDMELTMFVWVCSTIKAM